MWVLLLILQFFVYMAVWQVRYPTRIYFIFYELRKVALGELMDDMNVGGSIMSFIGLDFSDSSPTEEELGEARLGSKDPLSFFGPTLILGIIVLFLLILITVICLVVAKRRKKSLDC